MDILVLFCQYGDEYDSQKSIIIERKYYLSFRKMLENGPSEDYFEVRSKQFEIKKLHIELYKEL